MFYSCTNETPTGKNAETVSQPQSRIQTPEFNADSAFTFVKAQVDFGPRAMNTKAHDNCAQYLASKLSQFADTLIIQKAQVKGWDSKILNIQNIIASFSPEKTNRILLCAHWDTRPWADQDKERKNEPIDGANDGGSGVGVLIEIARKLAETKPMVGIDIILFDAEDYGQPENSGFPEMQDSWCLGSQYWGRNLHVKDYYATFGILLDMVGAKDAVFTMEGNSMQHAGSHMQKVWDTASRIGYGSYFSYERTAPIIDDHYYINSIAHIPAMDIIQYDNSTPSRFYTHWHKHDDKIEFIDKNTLKAVGQTILEVIFTEE